ncbi:hypothetical protein ABT009_28575 [Streptomyces sp. NPDC002896]|uniref:hypothetical protein n=1 Tax=Streptomyces sp. NPDC002896 TaxID=3154438 RepID=UPI00332ABA3D
MPGTYCPATDPYALQQPRKWDPNQQKYATGLAGPWTALTDIGDATAYGSQTGFVLPVQGPQGYVYLGDRWGNSMGGTVNDS